MSVLIEGVETEEQRVLLRLAGCNEMQGFLFAKPAPREEIDRLLAGERRRASAEQRCRNSSALGRRGAIRLERGHDCMRSA